MAQKSDLAVELRNILLKYRSPKQIVRFFRSKTESERHDAWACLMEEQDDTGVIYEHHCWPLLKTLFDKKYVTIDMFTPQHYAYVLAVFVCFVDDAFGNLDHLTSLLAKEKILLDGIYLAFGQQHEYYRFGKVDRKWNQCWTKAFLEWTKQKLVDRARLMDALLSSLQQGYSSLHANWYIQMFKALKPTAQEIDARKTVLAGLLESRTSSIVQFAFKCFEWLDQCGLTDDALLLKNCDILLRGKSTSKMSLFLKHVEKIIRRSPSLSKRVAKALVQVLKHESAEIQESAVRIFQRNPGLLTDSVTKLLSKPAPTRAPSVRLKLKELGIFEQNPPRRGLARKQAETGRKIKTMQRIDPLTVLKPIHSVDELIDLALKILADPSDYRDHELFLDALDRLHDKRDDYFEKKTSSIRKAIVKDSGMTGIVPIHRWTEKESRNSLLEIECYGHALCALMVVWLAESKEIDSNGNISVVFNGCPTVLAFKPGPTIDLLFINRALNLARRMCLGITQQSFSMPTHEGGWIDPVVFVKRLLYKFGEKNSYYDMFDYIYALYRLAPDRRLEALKLFKEKGKEDRCLSKTLKYLLGDTTVSFTKAEMSDWETNSESVQTEVEKKARKIMESMFDPYSQQVLDFLGQLYTQNSKERKKSFEKLATNKKFQIELDVLREVAALMAFDCPELQDEKPADPAAEKAIALKKKKHLEQVIQKALITAALRLRDPESDPIRYSLDDFPDSPPDPSRWTKRNKDNDYFPLYYLHQPFKQLLSYEDRWSVAQIRWQMTVFPSHPEPSYWHAILPLIEHIDAGGNYQGPNGYIEPLLDPQEPMGDAATAATLAALAAKQPSLSTLAQDIFVTTIGDGRLNSKRLAYAMEFHLRNDTPRTNRWTEKWAVIASVSPDHATVIRDALELALPAFPSKQVGPVLTLLYELSIATKSFVGTPASVEYLTQLSGTAGKTAKKLLALS